MFDNLKIKSKGSKVETADRPVKGDKPTKREIYQTRENFGVNLGACFVIEKWIYHSIAEGDASVELEAAKNLVKKVGEDEARKKFEDHWHNYMSDGDWDWLKDHGVNSVRLPIGYWDVDGGRFTKDTKFSKVAGVYKNAWNIIKDSFIKKAAERDISVVVDVHGLPGGANGDAHSGEKEGGNADFWSSQGLQLQACDLVKFIASDLKNQENIAAIQIVNESVFSEDGKRQKYFYGAAINLIREADKQIPVVISDGWWADQWAKWVQEKQKDGNIGVVVDEHCYRCHSDNDKKKSAQQIIDDLNGDLLTNLTNDGRGVDFMVGEYSCVLDGQTWDKSGSDKDKHVKEFGKRQVELFSERASFGSYFWTFKFEAGSGGEWDFKTMVDLGVIKNPIDFAGKAIPGDDKRDEKLKQEYEAHCNYWDNTNSKEKWEHARFKDAFLTAWDDSKQFAEFNGSVIGRKEAVKDSRLKDHIKEKGNGSHLWEWEHGYSAGLKQFKESF